MNDEHNYYGGIRIAAATAPAIMALAKIEPDRSASPLPRPANQFIIDRDACVFVVPIDGIVLLRRAVEDGMRLARADAVVVRWRKGEQGRDLIADVAIRARSEVTWKDNFRPWLDAATEDLWLIPEAPDEAVWFRLSARGVAGSAIPPFSSHEDRGAGLDRAKAAMLVEITRVLDADPIGTSVCRGAV